MFSFAVIESSWISLSNQKLTLVLLFSASPLSDLERSTNNLPIWIQQRLFAVVGKSTVDKEQLEYA